MASRRRMASCKDNHMRIVRAVALLMLVPALGWLFLAAASYPVSGKRYRALSDTLRVVVCEQLSEAAMRRADDQCAAAGAPLVEAPLTTCSPVKKINQISTLFTSRAFFFEVIGLNCSQIRSFVQPRLELLASAHVKPPVEFHVQASGSSAGSRPEPFRMYSIGSGTIDQLTGRGRLRPILTGCSSIQGGSSVVFYMSDRSTSSGAALRSSVESLVLEQLAGVALNFPVAPNCETSEQAAQLIGQVRNQFGNKPTLPLETHFEPCRLVRPVSEIGTYIQPRRLRFEVLGATCEQLTSQVQPRLKIISDGFEQLPLAVCEIYGQYYKLIANQKSPKHVLPGIYAAGTIGRYERWRFTVGEIYRPTLESCSASNGRSLVTYFLSDRSPE